MGHTESSRHLSPRQEVLMNKQKTKTALKKTPTTAIKPKYFILDMKCHPETMEELHLQRESSQKSPFIENIIANIAFVGLLALRSAVSYLLNVALFLCESHFTVPCVK